MGLFNLFKKEPNLPFDRINIIVLDSVGIGETYDSGGYEDDGANTLKHALECSIHKLDNLNKLGLKNLLELKEEKASAYHAELHPKSAGKETLTGHWEMMGVYNKEPLPSFTLNGFPSEMIKELERQTGYKFIGNCSASGTEIIERLGAEHIQNRSLILYTSADSVLQIAAHEQIIPVTELYRVCEIARKVSNSKPKWTVGRVIARPFIGKPGAFTRTSNRHDYALDPNGRTVLEDLIEKKYEVISVGKIADIFNNKGITKTVKTIDNNDGIRRIKDALKMNFKGVLFANLNDFDSLYGHRRNAAGYADALKSFDEQLPSIMELLTDRDLLIITADHGNDPTFRGTDHTRECVPLIIYSKKFVKPIKLEELKTFACIGATIADNFNVNKPPIGESLLKRLR